MGTTSDVQLRPLIDYERLCQRLGEELSFARRHGSFLALLLIEGVAAAAASAAEQRELVTSLAQMTRAEDVAALLPDGTLAILTRGISAPGMRQMAERLCALATKQRSRTTGERSLAQLFIGLVLFPVEESKDDDVPALLGRAQSALQRARATGTSCVKV